MPKDNEKQASSAAPWSKSYPVDIEWDSELPAQTMIEMFDESVKKYGDRTCLNFQGQKLTYKEVGAMVERFAKSLQDQGIGKNSTVGICLPNTPFYVVSYFGTLKTGAKVANFNPTSPSEALAQQIKDSKTEIMVAINLVGDAVQPLYPNVEKAMELTDLKKIIVCDFPDALPTGKKIPFKAINGLVSKTKWWPALNKKVIAFRDKKGVKEVASTKNDAKHISFSKMLKSKGALKPVSIDADDVAVLQYTGGTTGVPKGAALTHRNLTSNLQQAKLWFSAGKESPTQQKTLVALPFFHVFSMTVQMNMSIFMGDEMVVLPKPDVKAILEAIDKEHPHKFAAVPPLYKKMADFKGVEKYDLSSLKTCISGGAPLPETTMAAFKKLTGLDLVEGYGLSETSAIATANPVNGQKKLGSVGLPMPKTEVKFANIDFPDQTVPIKMEGEICLRGPQIMKEYFGRPDETAKVFDKDGFFHTGDVGLMDEDGYIFITDRIKDMIIVNGFKAFPKKIEEAIRKHEDVSEVIVIGIPDESSGEAVKAFVQPKEGKTIKPEDLAAFLKDKLTSYEMPREKNIAFKDSLPLTQIGKPDKKPLREEEKAKREAAKKSAPKGPGF
jgi:long-chain acyl-CoA synthetase